MTWFAGRKWKILINDIPNSLNCCIIFVMYTYNLWSVLAQLAWLLATSLMVRGSNPGGGEIFHVRPDRSWGPPNHLHSEYRFFPGGKVAGAWCWPPTPSSAEVKERVKLYFCSPSGSAWTVLGWTISFTYIIYNCGRGLNNTNWRTVSWTPLFHSVTGVYSYVTFVEISKGSVYSLWFLQMARK